jgi:hypothetical protein
MTGKWTPPPKKEPGQVYKPLMLFIEKVTKTGTLKLYFNRPVQINTDFLG